MNTAILCALLALPGLAAAVDVSTHSFGGCAFPDTGQTVHYSTAAGDDSDYQPSGGSMSFTIYNGVDWGGTATSSVTVDNRTGLMWLTNPTNAGRGATYTWLNALTACEGLTYAGFTDWRLPNAKELFSIIKEAGSAPYIDQAAFPATVSGNYWSSTTYVPATTYALYVGFGYGLVSNGYKTNGYYVRCVRAGP